MENADGLSLRQTRAGVQNETLQAALNVARGGFVNKRQAAVDALPEFNALKTRAIDIKNHTLEGHDIRHVGTQ